MPESSWRALYTAALSETDARKLNARIEAARRAINNRMDELRGDDSEARECQQLDSAMHALFTLAARKRSA
jgi:hypothetical protein